MPAPSRDLRRFAPVLAALCLLLGGCVYLRLWELKRQLADFDHYFAVDETNGLTFTMQKPVLLVDDMAFFKLGPESTEQIGAALRWHLRWIKDYAAPGEHPTDYEVEADFTFVDGKMTRVHLPERIFSFVQKSFVLQVLRSLGHASVDKSNLSARTTLDTPGLAPLTHTDLLHFLGAPLDTRNEDGHLMLHYRYTGVCASQVPGKIDFTYTLDATTQSVVHLEGKLYDKEVQFDWPVTQPQTPATTDNK
ncbi:MAG TPA: hypothetical protein VNV15_03615 [Opitutaceae bacterium]|jgi:hypothetical protein|nr:hypothetical protein [Opitutaceae bacterium]